MGENLTTILGILATIAVIGFLVNLVSKNWKRTLKVSLSWGLYEAYNFGFDFLIWPIIQGFYGFWGFLVLTAIALVNNLAILLIYQWKKVDLFGVNTLEDIKRDGLSWTDRALNNESRLVRFALYLPVKLLQFVIWALKKNDLFAFFALSVWQDSFITTVFLRHGKFDKLKARDYFIFISSTIFSCAVWGGVVEIVITAIKSIMGLLS